MCASSRYLLLICCQNFPLPHFTAPTLSLLDCLSEDASTQTEPEMADADTQTETIEEEDQPTVEEDLGASRDGSRTDAEAVER